MVRVGIIGIGNMGSSHAKNIVAGKVPGMQLVSVCDIDPERIKWAKENLKGEIKYFDNSEEFYKIRSY